MAQCAMSASYQPTSKPCSPRPATAAEGEAQWCAPCCTAAQPARVVSVAPPSHPPATAAFAADKTSLWRTVQVQVRWHKDSGETGRVGTYPTDLAAQHTVSPRVLHQVGAIVRTICASQADEGVQSRKSRVGSYEISIVRHKQLNTHLLPPCGKPPPCWWAVCTMKQSQRSVQNHTGEP
jgi:hypothetical protein